MCRVHEVWNEYALIIVDALFAYTERTQHLPVVVSFGSLIVPFLVVDYFLPRWVALSIYAAIGLPLAWFLGSMFWAFFTQEYNRQHREKIK